MSESADSVSGVPAKLFLAAAGCGELDELGLPDVRQSPFDTSFADVAAELAVPAGIHDVREALYPVFRGWAHNAIVRATVRIELNPIRRRVTARAETVDAGYSQHIPEVTGVFDLSGLSEVREATAEQVSLVGLRRFIGDFKIFNPRGEGGRTYFASLESVSAVERPFDGDYDRLRPRESVFVEGEVESYDHGRHIRMPGMPGNEGATIKLRQPDGSIMTISLRTFNDLLYSGASLTSGVRALIPPHALPGDRVQIAGELAGQHYADDPVRRIITRGNAMYLLDASAERQQATLAGHDQINEVLDYLGAASTPQSIRNLVGNYLASVLSKEKGQVICSLDDEHKKRLAQAVYLRLQQPGADLAEEWPVGLSLIGDEAMCFRLVEKFGKEALSMTRDQFHDLVRQFARGEYPTVDTRLGEDFFNYSKTASTELFSDFVLGTLNEFYDGYKASLAERQSREPEVKDRLQDAYVSDRLKRVLTHSIEVGSEKKIAHRLIEITTDVYSENTSIAGLRGTSILALTQSLLRCGIWEDALIGVLDLQNIDEDPIAIRAEEAYRIYAQVMPQVLAVIRSANEAGRGDLPGVFGQEGPYAIQLRVLEQASEKLARVSKGKSD